MDTTPRLKLPYIAPQQAQKQVTYNEAMRALDQLVQPVVKSRSIAVPPGSPAAGDAYLVATGGSGAWASRDGKIASYVDGAWSFLAPFDGWLLYVEDADEFVQRRAGAWSRMLGSLTSLSGYDEGSWTPAVTFGGAAVGVAYGASNAGRYTRIGRLCIATFLLHLTSKGSSTGSVQITGLPFVSVTSAVPGTMTSGMASGVSGTTGALQGTVVSGANRVSLYYSSTGASVALTNSNFTGTTQVQGVVIYDVV